MDPEDVRQLPCCIWQPEAASRQQIQDTGAPPLQPAAVTVMFHLLVVVSKDLLVHCRQLVALQSKQVGPAQSGAGRGRGSAGVSRAARAARLEGWLLHRRGCACAWSRVAARLRGAPRRKLPASNRPVGRRPGLFRRVVRAAARVRRAAARLTYWKDRARTYPGSGGGRRSLASLQEVNEGSGEGVGGGVSSGV